MSDKYHELPIVAGHRGFKAKYVENTLFGFGQCFATGATEFETDVWLTRDEVVVISHDVNTKRIFCEANGDPADYNILETDYYDTLRNLRTIKSGEPLLRFQDVLRWFVAYVDGKDSRHRIMLDIKRLNPPKLLRYLVTDMLEVKNDLGWWLPRVQWGVWDLNYCKYLNQHPFFQEAFGGLKAEGTTRFDLLHISLDWKDSLHYLAYNTYLDQQPENRLKFYVTGVSIIYIATWLKEFLTTFVPLLKAQDLILWTWTINNKLQYKYFVLVAAAAHLREYGVILDHPDLMMDLKDPDENVPLLGYIPITLSQRVAHGMFRIFTSFAAKRVTDEELDFSATVNENRIQVVKLKRVLLRVFALLQHWGIF